MKNPSPHLPVKFIFYLGYDADDHQTCQTVIIVSFDKGALWHHGERLPNSGLQLPDANRCDPPVARWAEFWREVERIGVWQWEPKYHHMGYSDGHTWALDLEFGGNCVMSAGSNAYPGVPLNSFKVKGSAFWEFINAVRQLMGLEVSPIRTGEEGRFVDW